MGRLEEQQAMRVGIFGGTFDPIHLGHLILAERCRDQANLDEVWFLPSAYPPHKTERNLTRFEQRCEMIELAIAGHPAFRVDRRERELPPPNYTVQTLAHLRASDPTTEFHLLIGSDSLRDLPGWYEPRRILEQVGLVVVPRPGVEVWTAERLAGALGLAPAGVQMQWVSCPLIEIASRDIRRLVAEGRSIRYLVPRAVEEYIRDRKLYAGR